VSHKGAKVLGGIQVRGTCTYPSLFGIYPDRPNETETEFAKTFGHAIAANMMDGKVLPDCFLIDPNSGGGFYDAIGPLLNSLKKKTTPLPVYDPEKCNLCGNCVNECPTESIKIENNCVRFHNTCIVCYRCWHVCQQNSISMKFSPGNGLLERLIYSERMERIFGDVKPNEDVGNNLYKDVFARKIKLKYSRKKPTSEYAYS
jgi:ferredoxin